MGDEGEQKHSSNIVLVLCSLCSTPRPDERHVPRGERQQRRRRRADHETHDGRRGHHPETDGTQAPGELPLGRLYGLVPVLFYTCIALHFISTHV